MKPLVNWLKVKKAAGTDLLLIEKLQRKVTYREHTHTHSIK